MSVIDLRAVVSCGPDQHGGGAPERDLHLTSAPVFDGVLDTALARGGQRLVVDLREVMSVALDGLNAVAAAYAVPETLVPACGCDHRRNAPSIRCS
jgi:hypothetical protein